MTDIPAPLTPESVEALIASEHYFTALQGAKSALKKERGTTHAKHGRTYTGDEAREILSFNSDYQDTLGTYTICVMTLTNGTVITGEAGCVDPANYNKEKGREIARAKAVNKIWPLQGYLNKELYHKAKLKENEETVDIVLGGTTLSYSKD